MIALVQIFGCASQEKPPRPPDYKPPLVCTAGGDSGCAVLGAVMLLMHAAVAPSGTGRKITTSINGKCLIKLVKPSGITDQPCQNVTIEVNGPGVKARRLWVHGNEFEITGIGKGNYQLEAFSEEYMARARLDNVVAGQFVNVELKIDSR